MKDNGNNKVILHINWKKYLYKCIKSFLTQINEQVQQCKYGKNHNFSNRYPNYMYLINKNSVISLRKHTHNRWQSSHIV